MRHINLYILTCLLLVFTFGCSPEEIKPLGTPFDRVQQIKGTWQIEKAVQIDTDAESKNFPQNIQRLDITNRIASAPFKDFKITFNVGAEGNPSTFSTDKGQAPISILDEGTWQYNNPEFPASILLSQNTSNQVLEISSFSEITSNKLILKLSRKAGGKTFLRYEYNLKKVQ